ncbi:MAG: hypothetical protein DI585_01435 [Pseudomonas fluorescens]|nr:MAG: hypothetical protein DI585_01435 [Pseudomonas fluorescens]
MSNVSLTKEEEILASIANDALSHIGKPLTELFEAREAADYQKDCVISIGDDVALKYIKKSDRKTEVNITTLEMLEKTQAVSQHAQTIKTSLQKLGII